MDQQDTINGVPLKVLKNVRHQIKVRTNKIEELSKMLDDEGVKYRTSGNDTILVLLTPISVGVKEIQHDGLINALKLYATDVIPILIVSEFGGNDTDEVYGVGQTICGLNGGAITPFAVSDRPNENHATFSVPKTVMLCRATYHTDTRWSLLICQLRFSLNISVENGMVRFNETEGFLIDFNAELHWSGSRFNECKRRYMTALAYAMAIATTPYCNGPSYCNLRDSGSNHSFKPTNEQPKIVELDDD